mgnify:CR=1 FL=1
METNHEISSSVVQEVLSSPEELKQESMTKLCSQIGYTFKMESPVDYSVNERVYKINDTPDAIYALGQKLRLIATDLHASVRK